MNIYTYTQQTQDFFPNCAYLGPAWATSVSLILLWDGDLLLIYCKCVASGIFLGLGFAWFWSGDFSFLSPRSLSQRPYSTPAQR